VQFQHSNGTTHEELFWAPHVIFSPSNTLADMKNLGSLMVSVGGVLMTLEASLQLDLK
jgi:hypothetical protein